MKKTALVALLGSIGLVSAAKAQDWVPMLDHGTQELAVSGSIDTPGFEKLRYDLDLSYGYFFADGWEVGANVGAMDQGGTTNFDVGGFIEYNFMRDQNWVPYVQAGVGLISGEFSGSSDVTASSDLESFDELVFDMEAGIKWFLNSYMAITTAINFELATDNVYSGDFGDIGDEVEDNLTSFKIGMRFYF